jgi:hypothetical protein
MIATVRRACALHAMLPALRIGVIPSGFSAQPYYAQDMSFFAKARYAYGTAVTTQMLQPSIDVSAKYGLIHSAFAAAELFTK